jgi:uncharacterized membrane protein
MPEYAVAITFPQNSTAYEALSKLPAAAGGFEIRSPAIVERDKDGHLHVAEGDDAMAGEGIAGGSLIGMLIGVLGGPVGMLLGWSAGAAGGALYDADRLDTGDEAIEQFGALVPTGRNALLAETMEDTTERLDRFVSEMGGTIVRRPLDEVVAELEAQQAAAEEAEKAARRAIREQKKQERKETRQQRVDALKAKFRKQ